MLDQEKIFGKFCEVLPETLELTEEQKREAFDFLFKISYQFLMRDSEN